MRKYEKTEAVAVTGSSPLERWLNDYLNMLNIIQGKVEVLYKFSDDKEYIKRVYEELSQDILYKFNNINNYINEDLVDDTLIEKAIKLSNEVNDCSANTFFDYFNIRFEKAKKLEEIISNIRGGEENKIINAINKIDELKIILIDIDEEMTSAWKKEFNCYDNIEIVNADFADYMISNKLDCIVSPANSFGIMDGGYDLAITNWAGKQLMERVQKFIKENYQGEQPVGTSFIIDTGINNIKLIHTPTMRMPSKIKDYLVVYQAMRTTLLEALKNNVKTILIPAFGGATGGVSKEVIANLMKRAYDQIKNGTENSSFDSLDEWNPGYKDEEFFN